MDTTAPDTSPDEQKRPANATEVAEAAAGTTPTLEAMLTRVALGYPAVHAEFMAAALERKTAFEAFKRAFGAGTEAEAFRWGAVLGENVARAAVRWCRASKALVDAYEGRLHVG